MPKGHRTATAADAIRAAGESVDVGNAGKRGSSIVVVDAKTNPARRTVAGKPVTYIQIKG